MKPFDELSREELATLVSVYAKNWLAHDGCWFLAAEEKYGHGPAVELDIRSWERFAIAEARRIKHAFNLPDRGGLQALEQALQYRLYAAINRQETFWESGEVLVFRMLDCRVQQARTSKNLPPFACKPVGYAEFSQFAKTIDPRIRTDCVFCPPDPVSDAYCAWRFRLEPD